MDARRRVLLGDGAVGVAAVASGLFFGGDAPVALWWVAAVVAVAVAGATWVVEHRELDEWTLLALAAAFGLATTIVIRGGGEQLVATRLVPAGLVGLGVGILAYRIYYGLLRPVPEQRLELAEKGFV